MDEKEILKLSLKDKFGSKKEATSANFAELIDAVFNYPGKDGEGKVGPDASKDIKEINIVKNAEGKTLSVNLTFTDESKRPVMIIPVIETIK